MTDSDYTRGPGSAHTRGPLVEVYAETGAIDRECPNCHAGPGSFCTHDGFFGRIERKVPCLARTLTSTERQEIRKKARQ